MSIFSEMMYELSGDEPDPLSEILKSEKEPIYSHEGEALEIDINPFGDLSAKALVDIMKERIKGASEEIDLGSTRHDGMKICSLCKVEMVSNYDMDGVTCPKCGQIDQSSMTLVKSQTSANNYNVAAQAPRPFRLLGPGGKTYSRGVSGASSHCSHAQEKSTHKDIMLVYGDGAIDEFLKTMPIDKARRYRDLISVPVHIMHAAAELYISGIQSRKMILRGVVRFGAMAACVYRICQERGVIRKTREIADLFHISSEVLSQGLKKLDEIERFGYIQKIKLSKPFTDAYLERYFEALKIPLTKDDPRNRLKLDYFGFCQRLIYFTMQKNIARSSITSSKCAGCIHILSEFCPELNINPNTIEYECNLARATYVRFSKAIKETLNYDPSHKKQTRVYKLKHIFNKYLGHGRKLTK